MTGEVTDGDMMSYDFHGNGEGVPPNMYNLAQSNPTKMPLCPRDIFPIDDGELQEYTDFDAYHLMPTQSDMLAVNYKIVFMRFHGIIFNRALVVPRLAAGSW